MFTPSRAHESLPFVQGLLQERLSRLSPSALLAIPFQGILFLKGGCKELDQLTCADFLILLCPAASEISVSDLEREHGATALCSARFCLTDVDGAFPSTLEAFAEHHPQLAQLLGIPREALVLHLAKYWAVIVVDLLRPR